MDATSIPGTGISFRKGGLHESLGVPAGKPIPASLMQEALSGKRGPKAKKQAELARTLKGFRKGGLAKTAAGRK